MESVENKIISKMKKCGRGSVFFVKFIHRLVCKTFYHFVGKFLTLYVNDLSLRIFALDFVNDSAHKVGFTKSRSAYKQKVSVRIR